MSAMSEARESAMNVVDRLRGAGHVAYFAGGCVRDRLLGLTPKDYDVATDAEPGIVRKLFPHSQAVGAAFGVILVRFAGHQIEIATFRADGTYSDGRRPDAVRFTGAEEDAKRRDFTINGLFEDPLEGKVIDFVGGQADIAAKVLRAIGNPADRFAEDHLRLLRAVRFAARFDLSINPPTESAIKSLAPMIRRIAPERVGEEVRRMLTAPPPVRTRAWHLLRHLGLLPEILRFVPCADRPELPVFEHLDGDHPSVALACAAMLLEESEPNSLRDKKPITRSVAGLRQSLRLSNDESEAIEAILLNLATVLPPASPTLAAQRRLLGSPTGSDSLTLLEALATAGTPIPTLANLRALAPQDNAPPPLITGDDLVALGLSPGPQFKTVLAQIYDAQLEGRLTSRQAALEMASAL